MKNITKSINISNLNYNISILKKLNPNSKICFVIKSNAYGHGIKNIIKIIDTKVDSFAVWTTKEAKEARKHTSKQILLLSPFLKNDLDTLIKEKITLSIHNKKQALCLKNYVGTYHKKVFIQLKFDTGMNRLGIKTDSEFFQIKEILSKNKNIKLMGAYTHLGGGNKKRDLEQIEKFKHFCSLLPKNLELHFSSTKLSLTQNIEKTNTIRVGLAIFGYGHKALKPVMEISTQISHISQAKKGEYIGYGKKHKTKKDITYAVLPIGYFDGLPRSYGKKGYVLINNKKAKICADICMNMTIVDITNIKANVGDKAIILDEKLNANIIAKKCKTIPYEILTNFRTI